MWHLVGGKKKDNEKGYISKSRYANITFFVCARQNELFIIHNTP